MNPSHLPGAVSWGLRSPLVGVTLAERARWAAAVGFDGIELGGGEWFAPPAAEILAAVQGARLRVAAVSTRQQMLDDDPALREAAIVENLQRLEKAAAVGAATVVVVPTFEGGTPFAPAPTAAEKNEPAPDAGPENARVAELDRRLLAALSRLAPRAAALGIRLALEPLNRAETAYLRRPRHALRIIRQLGSPAVGILSDFYHMQFEEPDIPTALAECGEATCYIHCADGRLRTEPGSLPFDYRPGFRVLKQRNYAGWITIEAAASRPENLPELLTRSLAYLRRQWDEA